MFDAGPTRVLPEKVDWVGAVGGMQLIVLGISSHLGTVVFHFARVSLLLHISQATGPTQFSSPANTAREQECFWIGERLSLSCPPETVSNQTLSPVCKSRKQGHLLKTSVHKF